MTYEELHKTVANEVHELRNALLKPTRDARQLGTAVLTRAQIKRLHDSVDRLVVALESS